MPNKRNDLIHDMRQILEEQSFIRGELILNDAVTYLIVNFISHKVLTSGLGRYPSCRSALISAVAMPNNTAAATGCLRTS